MAGKIPYRSCKKPFANNEEIFIGKPLDFDNFKSELAHFARVTVRFLVVIQHILVTIGYPALPNEHQRIMFPIAFYKVFHLALVPVFCLIRQDFQN